LGATGRLDQTSSEASPEGKETMMNSITSILHNSLRIMTPLLLAALGGLFTEMAGVLNIGLEGLMLISAFFSFYVAGTTGSILPGIIAGVLSSILLAFAFGYTSMKLRANLFITGIATNLLALAVTGLLATQFFGHGGVFRFPDFPSLPLLGSPTWSGGVGKVLLGHSWFVYLGLAAVGASAVVLYRIPFGLRLRAVGQDYRTVRSLGLDPSLYRFAAILISGLACGLAGSYLSLGLEAFVPNITAGRGWIALVIIYLGFRRPLGVLVASLLFGLADAFSNFSQGILSLPSQIILSFPYIISILALLLYSIWDFRRNRGRKAKLPPG
jgi:simple sugar transport system permease protein